MSRGKLKNKQNEKIDDIFWSNNFCLIIFSSCGGSKSKITGTYYDNGYKLTFMSGHAFKIVSPANNQTFSGTYTREDNTIKGDLGFGKEIYQIVDDNTISTNFGGKTYLLKKQ